MNYFRDSVSAIPPANLAKLGREWFIATDTGQSLGDLADVQETYLLEYPTERAISTVIIPGYQRPNREQSGGPLRLVLRYDPGPPVQIGMGGSITNITLSGTNIVPDGSNGTVPGSGGMVEKYYLLEEDPTSFRDEGFVNIFVRSANSTQAAAGNLDMKLELWVDENHQDAFALDNKKVFFDQFLARLQELNPGVIRTGPTWSNNNTASPTAEFIGDRWDPDWNTRPLPVSPRWSDPDGVPWEVHAWLANELQVNLWVCIPFFQFDPSLTDDNDPQRAIAKEYVQGLAALLRDELDPNLKLYVEYSNEAWNSLFTTNVYLANQFPGDGQKANRQNLFAEMTADIFDWFLGGFYPNTGNTQTDTRVQLMAMGHTVDLSWAQTIAQELQQFNLVDALGCTLYFPPSAQNLTDWEAEDAASGTGTVADTTMFNDLLANIQDTVTGLTGSINAHAELASQMGLGLYMYEGGPSLIGKGHQVLLDDFKRFQTTQLMADLLTEVMDRFVAGTAITPPYDPVTQFCYYSFCNVQDPVNGDFLAITDLYAGLVEANVDMSDQLKLAALAAFND